MANSGGETNSASTKMAAIKLPDRLTLGPAATKHWKIFKQRWQAYSIVTKVANLPQEEQKALFIHCLEDDALEAFNTFQLADDASINDVIASFETFIIGESNETYERFCFNRRNQEEGESFELFYADLQRLIKTCNYCDNCRQSILRDRVVLGINDSTVQKDLLKIRKLTLATAIDTCKASEKASTQNQAFRPEVNKMTTRKSSDYTKKYLKKCKFCGKEHEWNREKCPAFGKLCKKCNKKDHFAVVCMSANHSNTSQQQPGNVNNVCNDNNISDSEYELEWINKVSDCSNERKQIKCVMEINSKLVKFQIDTGSSVNIMPITYVNLNQVAKTDVTLKTWNKNNYKPLGECRVVVTNPRNKKAYNVRFIICHAEFTPILGLSASEKMQLIQVKNNNFEHTHVVTVSEYSEVFNDELGTFKGEHSLKLKPDARPTVMPDRRAPIALRIPLKMELDRLTKKNVITPVTEPTEWVSQAVVTKKANGSVRLCIDPQDLNKAVMRERYILPTLEDTLHELSQSKLFSKFDLSSGYHHVILDYASSKLTTFQTCYGRYRWLRMPFGLSAAAEIFQRKLRDAIMGLEGIVCVADDIIIHGKTDDEHDRNVKAFFERCREQGIKLNKAKSSFKVTSVSFMGHTISDKGLEIDPAKVSAINLYPVPKNITQLRTFLGMVNFLSKFIPNMSDVLHPLNNLLQKDVSWNWAPSQQQAFATVKKNIIESANLTIFDPRKATTIENDASEFGLGSVLLQENRPIAYASRSLSTSERNYAQIEKEMLAIVFGLNKFHHYVYGMKELAIITDHMPLVSIMTKPLSKAPKRIQSMLLRVQEYPFNLQYRPGTKIPVADALSRSPVDAPEQVNFISNLEDSPLNRSRFLQIREATENDSQMQKLKQTISAGWPTTRNEIDSELASYFNYRDEMTIENGIILRGERIVIPKSMRYEMKQKVHAGHTGINSCLRRARTYIFWPGMSAEIRNFVETCATCASFQAKQPMQPLVLHKIPDRSWQKIATDIFTIRDRNYLVTVDFYSQFFEVDYLADFSSDNVITKIKAHCARYGIPDQIISDNGPHYTSKAFKDFCCSYGISHETSAPGNSRANGAAEAAVKIAKNMMKKCYANKDDPYIALLNIRNTPNEGVDYSPVQRLMGRRTKTLLPTNPSLLTPETPQQQLLSQQRDRQQQKMSERYVNRNELKPLQINDTVRMQPIASHQKIWKAATVRKTMGPRSYIVETENGQQYRRDRQFLRKKPPARNSSRDPTREGPEELLEIPPHRQQDPIIAQEETNTNHPLPHQTTMTTTRSGRPIIKPQRLNL